MLKLGKSEIKMIFLSGLFLSAISFFLMVTTQKNFKATTDFLVVQNNQAGTADYFTLSKSAEFLGGVLMESIYSEKFLDEMFATNLISSSFLPTDKVSKLKTWQKMIKVEKYPDVGMVKVRVYANSQKQAGEISNAIIDVITNKNSLFLGNSQNIEMRVLSGPIIEKNPTISQIVLVIVGGFIIGAFLMVMRIYYKNETSKFVKDEEVIRFN